MEKLTIVTNNHPRNLLHGFELTEKEKENFDYLENIDERWQFVRYRGIVYDVHEFEPINDERWGGTCPFPQEWNAFQSDSFFSGVLLCWVDNFEGVVMGTYFS